MSLHQGQYRIASTRLKNWDYSQPGWYYVTICTHHRRCALGQITDGRMAPTAAGNIVTEEWLRTPLIRPDVDLDAWVLMPNHVHGIVIIKAPGPGEVVEAAPVAANASRLPGLARLRPGSVGAIVGQIKSVCTKRIRAAGVTDFDWQPRFHDRIIRDDHELDNVRQYILNNPAQWALDELNPNP